MPQAASQISGWVQRQGKPGSAPSEADSGARPSTGPDGPLAGADGRFRGDIQGLRAVAVSTVIAGHAGWYITGGFVGVDVFFVVSGYVITLMLIRELRRTNSLKLGRFYIRRAYRLLPAAALVCSVTAVATMLFISPIGIQQQAAVTGGAASAWTSNIALYLISSDYFSENVQENPFLHTWSLGVEEQFYILFPLVVLGLWLVARRFKVRHGVVVTAGLVALGTVSLWLAVLTSFGRRVPGIADPVQFAFYMMPTRGWEFALGGALAVLTPWLQRKGRAHAAAAFIGLVGIACCTLVINSSMPFPGLVALAPAAAAALVLYGGLAHNSFSRLLATGPMRFLGDRSYSWYLWHWPFLVLGNRLWPNNQFIVIVAVASSLIAAHLTYHLVESRFRGAATSLNRRTIRLPVIAVLVSGLLCTVLLAGASFSWGNDNVARANAELLSRPTGYKQCLSTVPISDRDLTPCTWGSERPGAPIYLLGDSNAQQYTEALIEASQELDRPLIIATWGGCPFFDPRRVDLDDPTKGQECSEYASDGTAWIASQAPGTIVMASVSGMIDDPRIMLRADDGSMLATPEAKGVQWSRLLAAQFKTLRSAGHEVVSVQTIPHIPGRTRNWWHPSECPNRTIFRDPEGCSVNVSRTEVAVSQSYVRLAELRAAKEASVKIIDLTDAICGPDECSTYRDGRWVYRDGLHISTGFSSTLSREFVLSLR